MYLLLSFLIPFPRRASYRPVCARGDVHARDALFIGLIYLMAGLNSISPGNVSSNLSSLLASLRAPSIATRVSPERALERGEIPRQENAIKRETMAALKSARGNSSLYIARYYSI